MKNRRPFLGTAYYIKNIRQYHTRIQSAQWVEYKKNIIAKQLPS